VDLSDHRAARRLLRLQRRAYRDEARLIGYRDIPALKDTVTALRVSGETFYGAFAGRRPLALVSTRREGDTLEICRLVVHPRCRRRGIASTLLRHVEAACGGGHLAVATAMANVPARELYRACGFLEVSRQFIPDGLELVVLRKALRKALREAPPPREAPPRDVRKPDGGRP
jgi:ribosomal protein S18 acetylase RimI-like enzyme